MRALLWAGAHLQDLLLGVALAGQVQGGAHAGGQVEAEEGVRLRPAACASASLPAAAHPPGSASPPRLSGRPAGPPALITNH